MQQDLSGAETAADFLGKEVILTRLFSDTVEALITAAWTEHLGYVPYEAHKKVSGKPPASAGGGCRLCESVGAGNGRFRHWRSIGHTSRIRVNELIDP
jgi:hypothetical protein